MMTRTGQVFETGAGTQHVRMDDDQFRLAAAVAG